MAREYKGRWSLVLNFSPIQFDDREISVGRLPYGNDGDQVLKQLRLEHYATQVFRREGPDSIFAVPVAADAPLIGDPETIQLVFDARMGPLGRNGDRPEARFRFPAEVGEICQMFLLCRYEVAPRCPDSLEKVRSH